LLRNLSAIAGACALDAMCGRIYRDLEASFESAIHRLRSESTTIAGPAAAERHVLGPSGLIDALVDLMYSSDTIGLIPEVVYGFAEYSQPDLNKWFSEL
jgi:hypothetical protein